jgi:2-polyprenyl-6-hydroxyphenyl methylase/3-demethylubiquinone-9 3-methyltransferase
MLEVTTLEGKKFLDIGSGSGLFSLAARRLGAEVVSFDYDPQSVACTEELRRRYFASDTKWRVTSGSVLDPAFLKSLGTFDIVYSWGVLHHTGKMWDALGNVAPLVARGGRLLIAIYNDQGDLSRMWLIIKRLYNALPDLMRTPFCLIVMSPVVMLSFLLWCLRLRPLEFFRRIKDYGTKSLRGMSYWHDLVDWVGGYPFEVAKPEEIFQFFRIRGFKLENLSTVGGRLGCNQFVFSASGT